MVDDTQLKCRKCRTILTKVPFSKLLNAHTQQYSNEVDLRVSCPSITGRTEIYLPEDVLGDWILAEIESSEWTKGKLKCSKCSSNVGSFDFVTGQKCDCRQFGQPPVHFIRSKIDVEVIKGT